MTFKLSRNPQSLDMIKGSLNLSREALNLDIPEVRFAPGLSVFRSALTAATASTYTLYDLVFFFIFLNPPPPFLLRLLIMQCRIIHMILIIVWSIVVECTANIQQWLKLKQTNKGNNTLIGEQINRPEETQNRIFSLSFF